MFSAQQKSAILSERFGPTPNLARADADRNFFANRLAMLLPFFRDFLEPVGANPLIVGIQFFEDLHSEFCAQDGFTRFDF